MTGLEALAYLRNHRFGAVRCKNWAEDEFILTKSSAHEESWWHYEPSPMLERYFPKIDDYDKPCLTCTNVFVIFEMFFYDVFQRDWEIFDATKWIGYAPVECEPTDYFNPEYPEDGIISRTDTN
jgi:hypothetical protein